MYKKILMSLIIGTMVMGATITAYAGFTPKYDVDIPEIPEIHVELSDEMKEAVKQAAQKQLEKMILDEPVVSYAAYCQKPKKYSFVTVIWNDVEGATSYKVEIVKGDGTKKTYETTHSWLATYSYRDEFISEGMDGATVRVRAYGEDETYSMWSDAKPVEVF